MKPIIKLFTIAANRPLDLPLSGEISFETLVKQYGSDVPTSTLLKELLRSEVVTELEDGKLRVLKPYYIPSGEDLSAITRASAPMNVIARSNRPPRTNQSSCGQLTRLADTSCTINRVEENWYIVVNGAAGDQFQLEARIE